MDPATKGGEGMDPATTDVDPATNGGEGTNLATTKADPAIDSSGGADPSTTNDESSRLGDSASSSESSRSSNCEPG